jgi:hypothetical protein
MTMAKAKDVLMTNGDEADSKSAAAYFEISDPA